MGKKILIGVGVLILLGAAVMWFTFGRGLYAASQTMGRDAARAEYALQDDAKVAAPATEPHMAQPFDPQKNLYWGDTHVHTHESFDAALFASVGASA